MKRAYAFLALTDSEGAEFFRFGESFEKRTHVRAFGHRLEGDESRVTDVESTHDLTRREGEQRVTGGREYGRLTSP